MGKRDILRLVVTLFVALGLGACTNNKNDKKKAKAERAAAQAELAKANAIKKEAEAETTKNKAMATANEEKNVELKKLGADLTNQAADLASRASSLQNEADALKKDQADWENNRSAREAQITTMTQTIQERKQELQDADQRLTEIKTEVETERSAIASERAALEKQKTDTEEALSKMRADGEEAMSADKAALAQKISDAETKLAEISAQKDELDKRDQGLKDAQGKLDEAQQAFNSAKMAFENVVRQHTENVTLIRELFSRFGLNDVFNKIEKKEPMKFLISITGRGSKPYAEAIHKEISVLNKGPVEHSSISDEPVKIKVDPKKDKSGTQVLGFGPTEKVIPDSFLVDDHFIVTAKAEDVKAFRDNANNHLRNQAKNGVNVNDVTLWVIARPIQKVRAGMKIVIEGSKSYGFKTQGYNARRSGKVAEFDQVRAADSKVIDIDQIDLAKPGQYVFASDKDDRKCAIFGEECIAMLKQNNFLEGRNVVTPKNNSGQPSFTATYRELLIEILNASIHQMAEDTKTANGMSVIGLTYTMEGGTTPGINTEALQKLLFIYTGFGETRVPAVESIEMSYRVAMVDEISDHNDNPADVWKYLSSGFIQDTPMFNVAKSRNEIEIELPVKNLKTSRTEFQDLSLKDFQVSTKEPAKPTLQALPNSTRPSEVSKVYDANQTAKADYDNKMASYNKAAHKERTNEFLKRLQTNMGMQHILVNRLKQ